MTPALESHIDLIKNVTTKKEDLNKLEEILKRHMEGEKVMGDFKELMTSVVCEFLDNFQKRRESVKQDPTYISEILEKGENIARKNARETLDVVYQAMRMLRLKKIGTSFLKVILRT